MKTNYLALGFSMLALLLVACGNNGAAGDPCSAHEDCLGELVCYLSSGDMEQATCQALLQEEQRCTPSQEKCPEEISCDRCAPGLKCVNDVSPECNNGFDCAFEIAGQVLNIFDESGGYYHCKKLSNWPPL